MFKATEEYKLIKKLCKDIINEELDIHCVSEGIIALGLDTGPDGVYEFSVITDEDIYRGMTVGELLDLNKLKYFEVRKKEWYGAHTMMFMWSLNDLAYLN